MFVASSGKLSIMLLAAKNKQRKTSASPGSPALGPLTASVTSCSVSWWFGCALSRGLCSALQEGGPLSPVPFSGFSCLVLYQGGPATTEGLGKLPPVCM